MRANGERRGGRSQRREIEGGDADSVEATQRRAPSLSWWDGSAPTLLLDTAVAVVIGLAGNKFSTTSALGLLPYGWGTTVVVVAVSAVFVVRRRLLWLALAAAALGQALVGMVAPIIVASYTVAVRRANTPATWLATAVAAMAVMVPWGVPARLDVVGDLTKVIMLVGLPVLLGLWGAQRQQLVASLRDHAEQAERERDLRAANAVAEERTRIARELHDIVAHRISQIAVLTGALAVSPNNKPAEAAEIIRATSTTALEEMRELLGVLRHGEGDPPLRPAPKLSGLHQLVADATATGQQVRLTVPDELPTVPGTVGRAVYRLVQEALTNAAKHAPGADVELDLGLQNGELTVAVRNGVGVPRLLQSSPVVESGFGLAGMHERVELANGRLSAGPASDGGFMVTASFPKLKR